VITDIHYKYNRAKRILKPIFIPFNHYVKTYGRQNILHSGPNLIVANHPGIGRDIAGVITAYNRQLYLMTAHYLFDEEEFLQHHIKPALGPIFFMLLRPIAYKFARYMGRVLRFHEMISVNKEYDGNRVAFTRNLRTAISTVKDYLLKGRAVVIFQIDYNILKTLGQRKIVPIEPSKFHPYIPRFNPTVGRIAYELYQESGLKVPVTPISIYGAEGLNPFRRMILNIGKSLDISVCLEIEPRSNPVCKFTELLEKRIAELLVDSGFP
jgi:1-acyl-sn-glycerol-3-phosphate acyltransferase